MKKALIFALAVLMLMLASCADPTHRDTPAPSDTAPPTEEIAPPASDKLAAAITESPEFKAGGTLKNIRVYFDNAGVADRIKEDYPDEAALKTYATEHGLNGYAEFYRSLIAEGIKNEISPVLDSHGISAESDRLQFGTAFAHLTFSEIGYDDLVSLSLDEKVTKIVPFDESRMIRPDEAEAEKISEDYDFAGILGEALPEDVFNVEVIFEFLSDSELNRPSSEERDRMAKEYAESHFEGLHHRGGRVAGRCPAPHSGDFLKKSPENLQNL